MRYPGGGRDRRLRRQRKGSPTRCLASSMSRVIEATVAKIQEPIDILVNNA
jgi:hypothetical protein